MTQPSDQAERDRFHRELEKNLSVIAAAGSGKTRAITDRIVEIARHPKAGEWLPKLVVVTFTHRAADEMQRRAREKMLESGVSLDVLAAFNRAFFGTIHSFCVKLLGEYGHYLGLPPRLDLITDDDTLWHDFVQSRDSIGLCLNAESRRILLRHFPVRQLMELGRSGNIFTPDMTGVGPCPKPNLERILRFNPGARSRDNIERCKNELREWEANYHSDIPFLPLVDCPSKAQDFLAIWEEAFGPFRKWMNRCALAVAAEIQSAYRDFRLDHGVMTYDDQVALTELLLQHPVAADRIRARNFRVILDEAQDTDPAQFSILIEIARPSGARGRWLELQSEPPRPGHFCMVGDFQQSIFSDRADLAHYRYIHKSLLKTSSGEGLKFSVTFRLNQRQVDFVNDVFPSLLNNADGQVEFVELVARPDALPGQVVRLNIQPAPEADGKSDDYKAHIEARQIANWIRSTGLGKLRARSWSDVAILCPRKNWFRPLRNALRRVHLDVQTQSERDLNADNPAHAWLTALTTVMSRPELGYEIVGVLREVFGISDDDLARFSKGQGSRFQIQVAIAESDRVAERLNSLAATRAVVETMPLYQAVQQIITDTQLRERLRLLPVDEFGDLDYELDRLIVTSAAAEADGKTLADFANDLRATFAAERESEPARRDAIQLITGQKAKGSEWDAVIVPYLSREVWTRSPDYARIVRAPRTNDLVVALGRDDLSKDVDDALKLARRQEMERLLYVALTRARHTLVLAFDESVFHNSRGTSPTNSQASWLQTTNTHRRTAIFEILPDGAAACATTESAQHEEATRRAADATLPSLPEVRDADKRNAMIQAADFVHKMNPSRVAGSMSTAADSWKETEPELRPLTAESAATRYGIWWHEFAQRVPWRADESIIQRVFAENQTRSPDSARSLREWRKLCQHLREAADFRKQLVGKDSLLHLELPFLWRIDKAMCLEGIIDLAVLDRRAGSCLIVDWKTNRIEPDETDDLKARYRPQIASYWKAMAHLTGMSVDAGIYSTSTGRFLAYNNDELADEWTRLRSGPGRC